MNKTSIQSNPGGRDRIRFLQFVSFFSFGAVPCYGHVLCRRSEVIIISVMSKQAGGAIYVTR